MRLLHFKLIILVCIFLGLLIPVNSGYQQKLSIIIDILTGLGVLFIAYQLHSSTTQSRQDRSQSILDKYLISHLKETQNVHSFLKDDGTDWDQKWNIIKNPKSDQDKDFKHDVILILGYFEDLAVYWNTGIIDKNIVMRSLGSTIKDFYELSKPIIEKYQEENPNYYKEWDRMYEEIERIRNSRFLN